MYYQIFMMCLIRHAKERLVFTFHILRIQTQWLNKHKHNVENYGNLYFRCLITNFTQTRTHFAAVVTVVLHSFKELTSEHGKSSVRKPGTTAEALTVTYCCLGALAWKVNCKYVFTQISIFSVRV